MNYKGKLPGKSGFETWQEWLLCSHAQFFIFSPQRTEEEFLDQVNRKLAQGSPEKDVLTMKPCHCEEILKLVLSPLTQHCLIIGETTCAFYYLLEAAAASLDLSDNYMVSKLCPLPLSWALLLGEFGWDFLLSSNLEWKVEESRRGKGAGRGVGENMKWECGSVRAPPTAGPAPASHAQSGSPFLTSDPTLIHIQILTLVTSLLQTLPLSHP